MGCYLIIRRSKWAWDGREPQVAGAAVKMFIAENADVQPETC